MFFGCLKKNKKTKTFQCSAAKPLQQNGRHKGHNLLAQWAVNGY